MEYQEAFLNETNDSPHFGDENSIRGAQPVVPLAEIRSNRLRNRLLLTLALLFAVTLGAGVALLLVELKQQPAGGQSVSKAETKQSAKGEDPTVAALAEEEEMIDPPASEEESSEVQQPHKTPRRQRVSPVPNSEGNAQSVEVPAAPARNPVQNDDPPRKPILVDQWEERRSRRVAPNERRRENVRRPELFRIREIFEGPRP
jgi:hypothetical protein